LAGGGADAALDKAAAGIELAGDRYAPAQQKMIDH